MNFNVVKKMIGFFVLAALVTVLVVPVAAQGTEFPPLIGPESPLSDLLAWTDLVYSAIVILLGYVSNYIPGLNKMAPAWRVVAFNRTRLELKRPYTRHASGSSVFRSYK